MASFLCMVKSLEHVFKIATHPSRTQQYLHNEWQWTHNRCNPFYLIEIPSLYVASSIFFSIRHHTSWDILFISWPQQNSIANSFSAKTPATQHGLKKITRKANVQEFWRTDERKVFCVINKARHGRVENIKYCPLSDSFSCATFMFLQSCQIFSNPSNMIVHFPYLY